MEFSELSDELKRKVRACQSPEEVQELAKDSGYDLSEDELESVSGGWREEPDDDDDDEDTCNNCILRRFM